MNVILISGVAFVRATQPRSMTIVSRIAFVIAACVAIAFLGIETLGWALSREDLFWWLLASVLIDAAILAVFAVQQFLDRQQKSSSGNST